MPTGNDPPKRSSFGGSACGPGAPGPGRGSNVLGRSGFRGGRHRSDRLQDLGSDGVGVALRVRAAIFEIALVAVIDEAVGHADRGATVSYAITELGDRCGLVLAG